MHEASNSPDPEDVLSDWGGRTRADLDVGASLNPDIEREITEMLRAERNAILGALNGGPPLTPEEQSFLAESRAFVQEQWNIGNRSIAAGGEAAQSTESPRVGPRLNSPRLTGRTALLPAPPGGSHAEAAGEGRGDGSPEPSRTPWATPFARAAAAALILIGIGLFAHSRLEDRGPNSRLEATPQGHSEAAPTYMGSGPADSPATDSLPPFPEPLDWSSARSTGLVVFEVVIKERGPKRVDEHGVLFTTDSPIFETTWSCPTDILESLPETVDVEVYLQGQAPGSPPLWRRSYSVPSSARHTPR